MTARPHVSTKFGGRETLNQVCLAYYNMTQYLLVHNYYHSVALTLIYQRRNPLRTP